MTSGEKICDVALAVEAAVSAAEFFKILAVVFLNRAVRVDVDLSRRMSHVHFRSLWHATG